MNITTQISIQSIFPLNDTLLSVKNVLKKVFLKLLLSNSRATPTYFIVTPLSLVSTQPDLVGFIGIKACDNLHAILAL